jgi:hypothetical protein
LSEGSRSSSVGREIKEPLSEVSEAIKKVKQTLHLIEKQKER